LPAPLLFEFLVIGRPASAQPRDHERRKDSRLARWRNAIRDAIDAQLSSRGFELHIVPMRVQIIWFLSDLEDETAPDLDNITKPFLDGLKGKVIASDQIFGEIHLRKVGINHQFTPEPALVLEARAGGVGEFVYVRVEPLVWNEPTRLD
jgi:Holliday junction resolvase RusA-like endonuclease